MQQSRQRAMRSDSLASVQSRSREIRNRHQHDEIFFFRGASAEPGRLGLLVNVVQVEDSGAGCKDSPRLARSGIRLSVILSALMASENRTMFSGSRRAPYLRLWAHDERNRTRRYPQSTVSRFYGGCGRSGSFGTARRDGRFAREAGRQTDCPT
jgi:hypothetical protein